MSEVPGLGFGRERTPSKPPRHWADLSARERVATVGALGLPGFRADQVSRHYCERFETDPTTWSDLPASIRPDLAGLFPDLLHLVTERQADGGATVKTLYRLRDANLLECVLMRYRRVAPSRATALGAADDEVVWRGPRSTLCVSSQAGCGIGCPFCATGQAGLKRNLSAGEIVEQVRLALAGLASGRWPGGTGRLNNVVFMGMGEPLANYAAVVAAIRMVTAPAPQGFGLSVRGITVSTAGLVPRIAQLAAEGLPLTLAVSLHAPDDDLRHDLVPINRRWAVGAVLDAARDYFAATGRRVSIEYALMRDINDQAWRADLLARRLNQRGRGWAHVNLIPLNPTPGSAWTASRRRDQAEFIARLEAARLPVTVRDTRGQDIDGACGQLAGAVAAATPAGGRADRFPSDTA